MNPSKNQDVWLYTGLGVLAILFWGSSVAFTRSLAEEAGMLTGSALTYLIGGGVGVLTMVMRRSPWQAFIALPRRYLTICGGCMVICVVTFALAVGLAANRQQVLEVGVINYLWPTMTLILSIPIQRHHARPGLILGVALAFTGVVLAMGHSGGYSWAAFTANLRTGMLPYLCALASAVSWSFYSNLSRRWGGDAAGWGTPVFLLASGIILGLLRFGVSETSHWTPRAFLELLYMAAFPALLGYTCWEIAMRRGRMVLVVALSYFTPVLSTLISAVRLGVNPGPLLWAATAMVAIGAMICKRSID